MTLVATKKTMVGKKDDKVTAPKIGRASCRERV